MRNNNTLTLGEYLYMNAMYIASINFLYSTFFFVHIRIYTQSLSHIVLISMTLLGGLTGVLADYKTNRNTISVLRNVILGPGLYSLFAYMPFYRIRIFIVMGITFLLIVLFSSTVLLRKIKNKSRRRLIIRRRVVKTVKVSKTILCMGLLVLMTVVFSSKMAEQHLTKASSSSQKTMSLEAYLEEHREIEALVQPDAWSNMPVGSQLWVLQSIVDLERSLLGIPIGVEVYVDELRGGLNAFYNEDEHYIVMGYATLERGPYDSLRSLLHELYHCYQNCLVKAYESVENKYKELQVYDLARKYKEELGNYVNSQDDLIAYAKQQVEIDARAFGQEAADRYIKWISNYLNQ